MKNYYQVLGVMKTASQKEIKQAYLKLVQKYHPDHNPSAKNQFFDVREAYETLSNAERRRIYDRKFESDAMGSMNTKEFYQKARSYDDIRRERARKEEKERQEGPIFTSFRDFKIVMVSPFPPFIIARSPKGNLITLLINLLLFLLILRLQNWDNTFLTIDDDDDSGVVHVRVSYKDHVEDPINSNPSSSHRSTKRESPV